MARVLVGFDGSPPSRRALEQAAAHASASGAELLVTTVIPAQLRATTLNDLMPAGIELPPLLARPFEESARLRLDEVATELARRGVKVRGEVRVGETAEQILLAASEHSATEIFIGRKSYEDAAQVGPNARAIRDGAKVPVTMVP